MLPLRSVAAGAEVRIDNLVKPNDVTKGDVVAIEVRSGMTRLTFTARAESSGRTGEMIAVRNPESNRIFRARISARNKAIVESDPGKEN
jgi:flagella basal body P-ring formation protein FlgA